MGILPYLLKKEKKVEIMKTHKAFSFFPQHFILMADLTVPF